MIYETIVSSVSAEGVPHVTPFGIRMQDGLVVIAPFKPSTTLANILATGHAVVNLTDDVRVFAAALAEKPVASLMPATKINGVRLAEVLAHKELKLVRFEDDDVRPQLFLEIVHEAQHQPFQGFNRAQAAVIELAVLVSRLKRLPLEKICQEIDYLTIAIEKTAGPRELEAWGWLIEMVENHKAALNLENLA
ncbi:DUF447 domain-containing protein [Methylotenera mobilis]|uniref:DUF447 domain-containing protein n=1 Tax=Methylotenera mobilis (strain JLW8 / ATCC BAA-1282 / DSM 17540) TaxID=583345 RepID=C6WV58_METML|nr:DUF447 domain-containing protein [Methylotenera mobilis]ACT47807.1 protein of unknown function DUF447 [Methylotenera mobilis JLW8]